MLKFIRNVIVVVTALLLAGYPYLLYSGYTNEVGKGWPIQEIFILFIILLSFVIVGVAAKRDQGRSRDS